VSKTNVAAAAKTLAALKGFFMLFTVRRARDRSLYLTVVTQCAFLMDKKHEPVGSDTSHLGYLERS
jgi:hypothetical protein